MKEKGLQKLNLLVIVWTQVEKDFFFVFCIFLMIFQGGEGKICYKSH